jgi:hypothetical protein
MKRRGTINRHGAVITNDDGVVLGWVRHAGCTNPACLDAWADGRSFHATPRGFAMTLPTYHYATKADAVAAIVAAAVANPAALAESIRITARCQA